MSQDLIDLTASAPTVFRPQAGCSDDGAALAQFLSGYQAGSAHTLRAYSKEAMRFLLWLRFLWPGEPACLPRVTPSIIKDYMSFLNDRGTLPATFIEKSGWPKRVPPFSGRPLKANSKAHVLHVLRALFDVLSNLEGINGQAYCRFNPLRGGRGFGLGAMRQSFRPTERGLSFEGWAYVQAVIADPGDDPERVRDRWIIQFLYLSFLRRSEAVSVRMGDFESYRGGWRLHVTGKGGERRDIVAVSALIDELTAYRTAIGLPPLPRQGDDAPAIGRLSGKGPIESGTLYLRTRHVFGLAADLAQESGDSESAQALRVASPHWLRHTGISHAMERGVEPRYVQAQARHSSLAITGLYDHKDRDAWASSMEKLSKPQV